MKNILYVALIQLFLSSSVLYCQIWKQFKCQNEDCSQDVRVLEQQNNDVIFGTEKGLFSVDNTGNRLTQTLKTNVYSYLELSTNEIYVGSKNFGVYEKKQDTWPVWKPFTDRTIIALAKFNNRLYVSTRESYGISSVPFSNRTQEWEPEQKDFPQAYVLSLSVFNNVLFAGTLSDGVYYNSNSTVWNKARNIDKRTVYEFVVFGSDLFCATDNGVYRSSNNGQDWVPYGMQGSDVRSIVFHNSILYVATWGKGVYRNINNNWENIGLKNYFIQKIRISGEYLVTATINKYLWYAKIIDLKKEEVNTQNRLESPKNNDTLTTYPLEFKWKGTSKKFILYDNKGTILFDADVVGKTTFILSKINIRLPYGKTYYWTVLTDKDEPIDFFSFFWNDPLMKPELLNPIDQAKYVKHPIDFRWSNMVNSSPWKLQISDNINMNTPLTENIDDTTYSIEKSPKLKPGQKYYWRVVDRNDKPWGPFSFTLFDNVRQQLGFNISPTIKPIHNSGDILTFRWNDDGTDGKNNIRMPVNVELHSKTDTKSIGKSLEYSTDGISYMLTSDDIKDGEQFFRINVDTGSHNPVCTISTNSTVNTLCWSNDDNHILSGTQDGALWEIEVNNPQPSIKKIKDSFDSVDIKSLSTHPYLKEYALWSGRLSKGTQQKVFVLPYSKTTATIVPPILLDKTDIPRSSIVKSIFNHDGSQIACLYRETDGSLPKIILFKWYKDDSGEKYTVKQEGTFEIPKKTSTTEYYFHDIAFSNDGSTLVAVGKERLQTTQYSGCIYTWDVKSYKGSPQSVKNSPKDITWYSTDWKNDGTKVFVAADKGVIGIYSFDKDKKDIIYNREIKGKIGQVDWSSNGKYCAFFSDKTLYFIDENDGKILKKRDFEDTIRSIQFSNDSRKIAIIDKKSNIYIIKNIALFITGKHNEDPEMTYETKPFTVKGDDGPAIFKLTANPTEFEFKDSPNQVQLSVKNEGNRDIKDINIKSNNGYFTVEPSSILELKVGSSVTVIITSEPNYDTDTLKISFKDMKSQDTLRIPLIKGKSSSLATSTSEITLSPTVCTEVNDSFILENKGDESVTINSIEFEKPSCSLLVTALPFTIGADSSQTVNFSFDPSKYNNGDITCTIHHTAPGGSMKITIKPEKQTIVLSASAMTVADTLYPGEPKNIDIEILNEGTYKNFQLKFTKDDDIEVPQDAQPIGKSSITINSSDTGRFTRQITFSPTECPNSNTGDRSIDITYVVGKATLDTPTIEEFSTTVKTPLSRQISLKNSGNRATDITLKLQGDTDVWSINDTKLHLKGGAAKSISIEFTPEEEKEYSAKLEYSYHDGKNVVTESIDLKGRGGNPSLSIAPIAFGEQLRGKESQGRRLQIVNKSEKEITMQGLSLRNGLVFKLKNVSSPLRIGSGQTDSSVSVFFTPKEVKDYSDTIEATIMGGGRVIGRLSGTGRDKDENKDIQITVTLQSKRGTIQELRPKDRISVSINVLGSELNKAIDASGLESIDYSIGLSWQPTHLYLLPQGEAVPGIVSDMGTLRKGVDGFRELATFDFEVLWGSTEERGSIVFDKAEIDTKQMSTSKIVWLLTQGIDYQYNPYCLDSLIVRGGIYRSGPIRAYPNPSGGVVRIELEEGFDTTEGYEIEIYDMYGRSVGEYVLQLKSTDIDMSDFPIGHYRIELRDRTKRQISAPSIITIMR
jgi:hypothetical protein